MYFKLVWSKYTSVLPLCNFKIIFIIIIYYGWGWIMCIWVPSGACYHMNRKSKEAFKSHLVPSNFWVIARYLVCVLLNTGNVSVTKMAYGEIFILVYSAKGRIVNHGRETSFRHYKQSRWLRDPIFYFFQY